MTPPSSLVLASDGDEVVTLALRAGGISHDKAAASENGCEAGKAGVFARRAGKPENGAAGRQTAHRVGARFRALLKIISVITWPAA